MQRYWGGYGGGGSWFVLGMQEGFNGILFGEMFFVFGQKCKWEDWEVFYYFIGVLIMFMFMVGFVVKFDIWIEFWVYKQVLECFVVEEEVEVNQGFVCFWWCIVLL